MSYGAERPDVRPLPGLAGLRIAAAQLIGGDDTSPVGLPAVYYPLVGLALGAAMVAIDRAAATVATPLVAGTAAIGFHTMATRGRPLAGLARTLLGMIDNRIARSPAAAALTQVAIFGVTVWVVGRIDGARIAALLFAPMLGRCAMVVMATGSRAARADGRLVKYAPDLTFREFGIASTAAFALVFLTTNFLGFLMVLVTGATTIALRLTLHWRLGGVDRSSLHGSGEFVQLAVLGLTALL